MLRSLVAFPTVSRESNLELIDPFGRAPRLHADVDMNHLDLELLTRTFDFGTITGRVDVQVKGLELVGWEPSKFDAHIAGLGWDAIHFGNDGHSFTIEFPHPGFHGELDRLNALIRDARDLSDLRK